MTPAILAIDPGPTRSAWLMLEGSEVGECGIEPNATVLSLVRYDEADLDVVIETIEPWGGVVGPPALETMFWVGRFLEAALPTEAVLLRRSKVLPALGVPKLPSGKAQAAVRAILLERWGGGNPVKRGHPLHGVRADVWSALALAVAYQEGLRP